MCFKNHGMAQLIFCSHVCVMRGSSVIRFDSGIYLGDFVRMLLFNGRALKGLSLSKG